MVVSRQPTGGIPRQAVASALQGKEPACLPACRRKARNVHGKAPHPPPPPPALPSLQGGEPPTLPAGQRPTCLRCSGPMHFVGL